MSKLVFEENYHVYIGTTPLADPENPTVAELEAGDDITAFIPKDGFNPGTTNYRVPAGDLATKFDAETMGSHGSQLTITSFMDDEDGNNTAFDEYGVRGWEGWVVACWRGAAVDGEPCFVWSDVESGSPQLPSTAANENQKFTAEFAVRAEPDYHAVVGSGS
jgi:hypothetical protein